jgi:hypothetical protein
MTIHVLNLSFWRRDAQRKIGDFKFLKEEDGSFFLFFRRVFTFGT